jgi:hypothetical protein
VVVVVVLVDVIVVVAAFVVLLTVVDEINEDIAAVVDELIEIKVSLTVEVSSVELSTKVFSGKPVVVN